MGSGTLGLPGVASAALPSSSTSPSINLPPPPPPPPAAPPLFPDDGLRLPNPSPYHNSILIPKSIKLDNNGHISLTNTMPILPPVPQTEAPAVIEADMKSFYAILTRQREFLKEKYEQWSKTGKLALAQQKFLAAAIPLL